MKALDVIRLQCYAIENNCQYWCRDLSRDDFKWKSKNGSPAIGWLLGHVLVSQDRIANQLILSNDKILPPEYGKDFNIGSESIFPDSYDPTSLLEMFKPINKKIVDTLSTKTDGWLAEYPPEQERFPKIMRDKNNMKVFIFHFNHSTIHIGQIPEIRRMLGKEVYRA